MTYDEFAKHVNVIRQCLMLKPKNRWDRYCIERTASVFSFEIEKKFSDGENNFRLWLNGKPCYFKHPQTKNTIAIEIGDSIPAIYHFLGFCKGLKEGKHTDIGYLAFLLSQKNNSERIKTCPTM